MKRVVTGAHYGLKDWLAQRVTALVMALYVIVFVGILLICPPRRYEQWRSLFDNQVIRIATLVFFISLFWHAWIGVRDVLMDYVKPTGVRLGLEIAVVLVLAGYAIWAVQILWSL
ncbi:MAG TPA: succinate dehydrogenase, hydrophobic membrane anchor protein [Burkholderiales bacterium]|nr:succinate dehydrogenase, hydrophobic membrane anchor protein [Burkholderiales bacterium]